MSEAPLDPARIPPGTLLAGRYELIEPVGSGGFAWVYRAHDRDLGEPVAIKLMALAPERLDRARQELRAARRVTHPNVVRIHDLGESAGLRFISMEYVAGRSLRELLRERGALPVGEALRLFRQVAAGVAAAHEQGVIHRDLKPGNILLTAAGAAKVADFGIARVAGSDAVTATGGLVGTPDYMAPEQVEGRAADCRCDVYGLGTVLFEMLAGCLPFRGETPIATALARLGREAPGVRERNPAVPAWLAAVVARALQREPEARFATVGELLAEIERGEGGHHEQATIDAPAAVAAATAAARGRGRRLALALAPYLLLALAAGFGALALRGPRPPAGESGVAAAASGLLGDGVARIVVADFQRLRDDDVTRMLASGIPEAVRARLDGDARVQVIALGAAAQGIGDDEARALRVEQVLTGSVARLGEEVRVVVAVTSLPGHERWLTVQETLRWEDTWEGVDRVVNAVAKRYLERLAREPAGAGSGP